MKKLFGLFFLLVLLSCNSPMSSDKLEIAAQGTLYAKNFSIANNSDGLVIETNNLWATKQNRVERYLLTNKINTEFNSLYVHQIKIPVERVVCMSASQVAQIAEIDNLDKIIAVSGAKYIYNSFVENKVNKNEIVDIPSAQNFNIEELASLQPDIIFMYGVQAGDLAIAQKIRQLGIPVVFNNDYLESSPLGRAEWTLFTASFFGKYEKAKISFDSIVDAHQSIKKTVDININNRPSVFLNIPFKDIWYMPGGESYFAQLIRDAGGKYVFTDNRSAKSLTLDFEYVFNVCNQSDYWLNIGTVTEFNQLSELDERMINFKAFQTKNIYSPVNRMRSSGANDFWETGVTKPHLLLQDLVNIFIQKKGEFTFYQVLQ